MPWAGDKVTRSGGVTKKDPVVLGFCLGAIGGRQVLVQNNVDSTYTTDGNVSDGSLAFAICLSSAALFVRRLRPTTSCLP